MWASSAGVERPEEGEEGAESVRAAVREARVGWGSVDLVRLGRKENVTGNWRAWEAAVLAAARAAAGVMGQRREI